MSYTKNNFINKSILAGLCISIVSWMNCICVSKGLAPLGAAFFGFGLITVINKKYYLYTGRITCVLDRSHNYILLLLYMLFFNMIVSVIMGLMSVVTQINSTNVVLNRFIISSQYGYFDVLIKSIMCGICMYIAVKAKNIWVTLGFVSIFVLSGWEHCVADTFYGTIYCWYYPEDIINVIKFLFVAVCGNTIGGIIFPIINKNFSL